MTCRLSCRHLLYLYSTKSSHLKKFRFLFIFLFGFGYVDASLAQEKSTIRAVDIEGNKSFSSREVLSWLNVAPGSPFSEDFISTSVSQILRRYREEGYYSASVDSVSKRTVDDGRQFDLVFHISEGERSDLGAIKIKGNQVISEKEILELFETKIGVPLRQDRLERDIHALLERYEAIGYPFARVEIDSLYMYEENRKRRLGVALAISEGVLTTIEEVKIEGNKDTKENVILRELRIKTGEPYNHEKVRAIKRKLERLHLFSSVSEPELFMGAKGGGLLIKVQEGNPNSFDGIVGYVPKGVSDQPGFFTGYVNIALQNLFGTGRRFSARWQREGQLTQEAEVLYLEPWLLNMPVNLGVGFLQREQDSTYVRRRIDLRGDVLIADDFSISLLFTQDQIIPSATLTSPPLLESRTSTIGGEVRYDSRDDPYGPTSGIFYRSDYRIGRKSLLGSEAPVDGVPNDNFLVKKFGLDLEFYVQPVPRQVIATGLHANDLRSDHIEDGDLYRFGGTNTLRGYRENQFVGSSIAWSNLEYRFLLGRRSFFYGFVDAGYYFRAADERKRLPPSEAFKVGYGAGFRVETSLGLIGVSYALGRGDTFSTGKIHFGLVHQF